MASPRRKFESISAVSGRDDGMPMGWYVSSDGYLHGPDQYVRLTREIINQLKTVDTFPPFGPFGDLRDAVVANFIKARVEGHSYRILADMAKDRVQRVIDLESFKARAFVRKMVRDARRALGITKSRPRPTP